MYNLTKEQRLASRWAPQGAERFEHETTRVVVFIYPHARTGRPCMLVYSGTSAKPYVHEQHSNAWARAMRVANIVAGHERAAEYKAERRAEQRKPHNLQVGHILNTSWGYEQTNVEFFEVVKVVSPHMVEIRQIKAHMVENGEPGYSSMSAHVIPRPGEFCGETTRHRVNASNSVSFASYRSAGMWCGRPCYVSWYG